MAECEGKHLENQEKAEYIYNKYQKVDELLKRIRELRKKHSWKEIKEMVPEIKEVDEKNHRIMVDL